MLRLKGRMLDRLPPEKRAKMERTLQRMEDSRRKDEMRIREIVEVKKQWSEKERQKGLDIIDQLEKRKEEMTKEQDNIRLQLIKIDGCILALTDVLTEANKIEAEEAAARAAETARAVEEESRRIAEAEAYQKAKEAEAIRFAAEEAAKKLAEEQAKKLAEEKPKKKIKKDKIS
jgi:membrane protein involved in colicin uptake